MRWYGTKAHYYTILRDVHIEESALNEDVGYLTNFRDLKQNVKSRRFCHVTSNLSHRSSIKQMKHAFISDSYRLFEVCLKIDKSLLSKEFLNV